MKFSHLIYTSQIELIFLTCSVYFYSPTGSHERKKNGGYQIFKIRRDHCQKLLVTVVRGRGITRGRIKDWRKYSSSENGCECVCFGDPAIHSKLSLFNWFLAVYSPDPYVSVQLLGTPNGQKRTKHVASSMDPIWNETLEYYLDAERDRLVGKESKRKKCIFHFVTILASGIFSA